MKRHAHPFRATCHSLTLHTTLHKKSPWKWEQHAGEVEQGNVEGIQKYSFIARWPQNEVCAVLVGVVVGRGLYALCLKPHQKPWPCVMWYGWAKEGSLLDSEEPPLRYSAGMGGRWCKLAFGNKQLWLRVWWLLSGPVFCLRHDGGVCHCKALLLILDSVFFLSIGMSLSFLFALCSTSKGWSRYDSTTIKAS